MEAKHKVDLMKVAHELESTKLALADVTKVKDEKDAALSIVQQDFDRALEQALPTIVQQNAQLTHDLDREKETVVEVLGLLARRDDEYQEVLLAKELLESQTDVDFSQLRLENDVLKAKVYELEEVNSQLNNLYDLKLQQDSSRPSTPAHAPKGGEQRNSAQQQQQQQQQVQALNDTVQQQVRALKLSRQNELVLEKQVPLSVSAALRFRG